MSAVLPRPVALVAAGCLFACAGRLAAFEVERSEAHYADRRFQYELSVTLDAPIERVEAVLRDYESYPSLDARILQARVLERPRRDAALLETVLRACFGPFCRNVRRIEIVEEAEHLLCATSDPERSDVRFGETRTVLSAANGRTRVHYITRIVPDFWIPALIGRRWMLRTLEEATLELFANVERAALTDR